MDRNPKLETIDHILVSEEAMVPTSGFASAVMERLDEESKATAPIPFPWKRALPGIVLAAVVFSWGGLEMIRQASAKPISLASLHFSATAINGLEWAGWVALALTISMLTWSISSRLFGRSGLL